MKMYATPVSRWISWSRLTTCACTETSRADTGSSHTITEGFSEMARAIPTRWRWPPENSCGKRL